MNTNLLKNIYRHQLLTEIDLQTIVAAHQKISVPKGTFLLEEGQIANAYFIMESGLARSFVHDFDCNDITTNFFTTNEIVIEVSSLFQRIPTQENIQSLTDCSCWKIDYDTFQQLFHSIEGFREWGRAWMANSLFELKKRSVAMVLDSATTRYQRLTNEKPEVLKYAPLKCVASYLGITDSSLSRIRKDIAKS